MTAMAAKRKKADAYREVWTVADRGAERVWEHGQSRTALLTVGGKSHLAANYPVRTTLVIETSASITLRATATLRRGR